MKYKSNWSRGNMNDQLKTDLQKILSWVLDINTDMIWAEEEATRIEDAISKIDQVYKDTYKPWMDKWDNQTVCGTCFHRFTAPEDCQLHIDKFHPTGLMTGETFYERFLHEASDLMDAARSEETKMSVGDIYREAAKRAAGLE